MTLENQLHDASDDDFVLLVQRAATLIDAPAKMQRAAIALWAVPQVRWRESARAAFAVIVAGLSFDSWSRPSLAFGMRAVRSETRHLLFSAKGRDVDLRISGAAGSFAMAGQILGPDDAGEIALQSMPVSAGSATRIATLDDLGEFQLTGLCAGTYQLTLRVGTVEIVLPLIEVGPRD